MTPIFDSLTHPTISGKWLNSGHDASFETLAKQLKKFNFLSACAIGLSGIEDYSHEAFINECKKYQSLVPIAGFDPNVTSISREIEYIKKLGFKGIKIHPRYSLIDFNKNNLLESFKIAALNDLIVFYCTYVHTGLEDYPTSDPFYFVVSLLKSVPNVKVVLVHGGDVQLLKYSELVRFNSNLLLDLSLTMMKYENSSIDLDIKFLLKNFDKRICIGTDYPEYSYLDFCNRFDYLSNDISNEKKENIAYKNLINFLKLEQLVLK